MNPRDLLDMAGDPGLSPASTTTATGGANATPNRALSELRPRQDHGRGLEEDDESDTLAEQLGESLQDAVDLIEIIAEEEGIELDLDSPEVEEMMQEEQDA